MLFLEDVDQFNCVHLGLAILGDLVQVKKELVKVLKPNSLLVVLLVLLSLLSVVCVSHEAVHVSNLGTQKEGNAHNYVNAEVFAVSVAFIAYNKKRFVNHSLYEGKW
jgi:hypothetical protein